MNPQELEAKKQALKAKYGLGQTGSTSTSTIDLVKQRRNALKQTGFVADIKGIGSDIKASAEKRSENLGEINQAQDKGEQGVFRSLLQKGGQALGFASDVVGSTVMGAIKALTPQGIQEKAGEVVQAGAEKIGGTDTVQKLVGWYSNLDDKSKRDIDAVLGATSFATDVAGGALAKKPITQAVQKTADVAVDVVKQTPRITSKIASKVKGFNKADITPQEALGEVLGGKKEIPKGTLEAFQQIDTKNVETFKGVENEITNKIGQLAKSVDDDLGADATKIPLEQLKTVKTTKSGASVEANYVDNALRQLEELYDKAGDIENKANIQELIQSAKADGLTRLEVNDIARIYGQEFKDKAFSKLGEPMTSVNAQLFENTRKGLKEIARAGIKGEDAKKADLLMSKLYNVQKLIRKNSEAVNGLQRKIEKRGLLEKIGHGLTKYADVISGGTIRGLVGGLLPRGVGNKTLNALDLEELLKRNLRIIREAGNSKTTKQFNEQIKKLSEPLNKKNAIKGAVKATAGTAVIAGDE